MSGFNSSSNKLTPRCPDPTGTDCVQYFGPSILCLGIETGCILTTVMCNIATTLCTLVGEVDMSSIVIPQCFVTAWNSGDLTILNLLQFILKQGCDTNNLLADVINGSQPITGLDPVITVTYPQCCTPGACNSGTTVAVSQHITNILNCLCTLSSLIGNIPGGYANVGCSLSTILTSINSIIINLNAQAANTQNIVTVLQSQGFSFPGYSPITPLNPPAGC